MRVLMTRRYPDRVIAEAQTHFEVEIREETAPLKPGQMRGALALYDGIMPTLGDAFSAQVFAEYDQPRCKVLANFGVGYNHIDAAAARAAGVAVTNTAKRMRRMGRKPRAPRVWLSPTHPAPSPTPPPISP